MAITIAAIRTIRYIYIVVKVFLKMMEANDAHDKLKSGFVHESSTLAGGENLWFRRRRA